MDCTRTILDNYCDPNRYLPNLDAICHHRGSSHSTCNTGSLHRLAGVKTEGTPSMLSGPTVIHFLGLGFAAALLSILLRVLVSSSEGYLRGSACICRRWASSLTRTSYIF